MFQSAKPPFSSWSPTSAPSARSCQQKPKPPTRICSSTKPVAAFRPSPSGVDFTATPRPPASKSLVAASPPTNGSPRTRSGEAAPPKWSGPTPAANNVSNWLEERQQRSGNLYHVKELLGHASLATLKHYAKLNINDIKKTHHDCHPREKDAQREEDDSKDQSEE